MLEAASTAAAPPEVLPARAMRSEPDITSIVPPQPKTIRDTGLDEQLVLSLVLKAIGQAGKAHLPALASRLRLSINVLHEALDRLVAEQAAEVAWRGSSEIDVQYHLTVAGKLRTADCLAECGYVGAAPVTLEAFRALRERDALRHAQAGAIGASELAAALAEDGLDPALRELIGAALHSRRPLLLHGPSGSGKSTLARKLGHLLQGVVGVPYALLIERHIVQFHDPLLHLAPTALQARQFDERRNCDSRWTVCQRPLVQVGAELTEQMLDLRYDAAGAMYRAPPHFQASGGMFVIDDLGRQRMPLRALLNRWIAPLDHGVDLLTLQDGHTESVPFDVTLVLATSLAPHAVLDDALMRRIAYRIGLGPLSEANYRALLRQQCRAGAVSFDEAGADYLLGQLHAGSGRPLLPSYPRELLGRIADFASVAGSTPRLGVAALDQAWNSMFDGTAPPAATLPTVTPARGAVLFGER